ncbi:hypothetical protein J1N09_06140 [Aureitalea sp. L0-47]|uniref:hypothetical protein n=1 Tax=Aureitalea sp. L0-47 TaxID=2816962 RepID=UPI002237DB49|nr:hypothetical protein [Aureitalea sp. L0-47]MCW5519408.1 hypothetical protein [Aureitalea sp. L0-47]
MAKIVFRDRSNSLSEDQKNIIRAAFRHALVIQRLVEQDFNALMNVPRRRRKRAIHDYGKIKKWIGIQKRGRLRRIARRVSKLRKWLENRRILVVFHEQEDFICADTRRGASRGARYISPVIRFHMCEDFFNGSGNRMADLIIHELCHEMGHLHAINDRHADILALAAGRDAHRVARNPLTYQGLFREYTVEPINV